MDIELIVGVTVLDLFVLFSGLVLIGPVMIGSNQIAIVEKRFSSKSLKNGDFIALNGEAGFQADTLGPGLHFRCRIIYKIYKKDRVTIKQGKSLLVIQCQKNQRSRIRILSIIPKDIIMKREITSVW